MKSNAEASRLLIRMIIGIASSDGNFDADEKKIAAKIAKELGLNPAEFELI
jgi:tellurite resistance protein TerB